MRKYLKILLLLLPLAGWAQQDSVSLEETIQSALNNNKHVLAASNHVLYQSQVKKTSSELPKTEVGFLYGQYNSILKDNNVSVMQTIPFPTVFSSKNAYHRSLLETSKAQKSSIENELIFQVKELCFRIYHLYDKKKILFQQDSIYNVLNGVIVKKFQSGDENQLQVIKTNAKLKEIENATHQVNADIDIIEEQLQALLNSSRPVKVKNAPNKILDSPILDVPDAEQNPAIQAMKYEFESAENLKKVERAKALPEFKIGFFTQTLIGTQNVNGLDQYFGKDKRFNGFQAGIGIPIWFFPHASQVKAYDYAIKRAEAEYQQTKIDWMAQLQKAQKESLKDKASLEYYITTGLPMASLIQSQAITLYKQGEISISELLLSINHALTIRESYLETLLKYNLAIINIEFLIGQKS